MIRILSILKQYEDSLTLKEVIEMIESKQLIEKENEEKEMSFIKSQFENSYVKYVDKDSIYGKSLIIYYIKSINSLFRYEDKKLGFNINCTKIHFSNRDVFSREYKGDDTNCSVTLEFLNKTTKISKKEYNGYKEKYNTISSTLEEIIK